MEVTSFKIGFIFKFETRIIEKKFRDIKCFKYISQGSHRNFYQVSKVLEIFIYHVNADTLRLRAVPIGSKSESAQQICNDQAHRHIEMSQ